MADVYPIHIKRGQEANLESATFGPWEPLITTDTHKFYVTDVNGIPLEVKNQALSAKTAEALSVATDITLSGDVIGTASTVFSAETVITTALKANGVVPGQYNIVTVDDTGRVTTGSRFVWSESGNIIVTGNNGAIVDSGIAMSDLTKVMVGALKQSDIKAGANISVTMSGTDNSVTISSPTQPVSSRYISTENSKDTVVGARGLGYLLNTLTMIFGTTEVLVGDIVTYNNGYRGEVAAVDTASGTYEAVIIDIPAAATTWGTITGNIATQGDLNSMLADRPVVPNPYGAGNFLSYDTTTRTLLDSGSNPITLAGKAWVSTTALASNSRYVGAVVTQAISTISATETNPPQAGDSVTWNDTTTGYAYKGVISEFDKVDTITIVVISVPGNMQTTPIGYFSAAYDVGASATVGTSVTVPKMLLTAIAGNAVGNNAEVNDVVALSLNGNNAVGVVTVVSTTEAVIDCKLIEVGSSTATWGNISGTLAYQGDLDMALNERVKYPPSYADNNLLVYDSNARQLLDSGYSVGMTVAKLWDMDPTLDVSNRYIGAVVTIDASYFHGSTMANGPHVGDTARWIDSSDGTTYYGVVTFMNGNTANVVILTAPDSSAGVQSLMYFRTTVTFATPQAVGAAVNIPNSTLATIGVPLRHIDIGDIVVTADGYYLRVIAQEADNIIPSIIVDTPPPINLVRMYKSSMAVPFNTTLGGNISSMPVSALSLMNGSGDLSVGDLVYWDSVDAMGNGYVGMITEIRGTTAVSVRILHAPYTRVPFIFACNEAIPTALNIGDTRTSGWNSFSIVNPPSDWSAPSAPTIGDYIQYTGTNSQGYFGIVTKVQSPMSIDAVIVQVPVSASTITWGGITGTLSDQADLQAALDNKIDKNTVLDAGTF